MRIAHNNQVICNSGMGVLLLLHGRRKLVQAIHIAHGLLGTNTIHLHDQRQQRHTKQSADCDNHGKHRALQPRARLRGGSV